eukprot:TRINITY_DN369_c0_g1_i1.p1 TRINITY_DN369_c0_g1~~TRINITY_DN369_c0_g1_i1.p1  ORF type:complete len:314 (+),score=50.08 TRINITY_DN369_c0_g1_i1:109-1050(+)
MDQPPPMGMPGMPGMTEQPAQMSGMPGMPGMTQPDSSAIVPAQTQPSAGQSQPAVSADVARNNLLLTCQRICGRIVTTAELEYKTTDWGGNWQCVLHVNCFEDQAFAGELYPTKDAAEASAAVMAKEQVEILAAQAPPQHAAAPSAYQPPSSAGGGWEGRPSRPSTYTLPAQPSNDPPHVKIEKAARACIYHLKDGRQCMNSDTCQFSHDPQDISNAIAIGERRNSGEGLPMPNLTPEDIQCAYAKGKGKGKRIIACKFHMANGAPCKQGDACTFSHDPEIIKAAVLSGERHLGFDGVEPPFGSGKGKGKGKW